MTYLTESTLGNILENIFGQPFIHNKAFSKEHKFRPDYRNDDLKLIVEFDGFRHYNDVSVIIKDEKKDEVYKEHGYKVVRIPYFVQLETRTINFFFSRQHVLEQKFPHGFISKEALLPANFCQMGTERFIEEITSYPSWLIYEICTSLEKKIEELGDERYVLSSAVDLEYSLLI